MSSEVSKPVAHEVRFTDEGAMRSMLSYSKHAHELPACKGRKFTVRPLFAAQPTREVVAELIDAAQWALKLDDAGAMSETARYNLEQALLGIGGAMSDAQPNRVPEAARDEQVMTLAERVGFLELEYAGLRRAGDKLGIDPGYLSRLKSGEKNNPSDDTLRRLGLSKRIGYAVTASSR